MVFKEFKEPVFVYSAECDICKTPFEHPIEGWTTFLNEDYMLDSMGSYGWYVDEKHYCPTCHTIDDDDNLIIKPQP